MNIDFNVTTFVESKNLEELVQQVRSGANLAGWTKQNPSKTSAAGKKTSREEIVRTGDLGLVRF